MKLEKLLPKDWRSPRLRLVDPGHVKPKLKHRVIVSCYSCNENSDTNFYDHVRKVNNQSKHVNCYHCPKCFRSLDSFKERQSIVASKSSSFSKRSETAKERWKDPSYREKMVINHERLSVSEDFKEKMSKAIKEKFRTDQDYVDRVTKARSDYYDSPSDDPRTLNQEEFIGRCVATHGNKYDYSKTIYINQRTKVIVVCPKHGDFETRPTGHVRQKNGCPKCNTEKLTSIPENELADWIASVYDGKIERSNRSILNGLELDIWLPDANVGIEYHGAYFHSFNIKESTYHRNYHSMKSAMAYRRGFKLLQFVDLDYSKRRIVADSMIKNSLGLSSRIYARKCSIIKMDNLQAKRFFDDNHYHCGVMPHVAYALENDGKIVSVLSLTRNDVNYSISRFANIIGHTVIGGFSKLMKSFIKFDKPTCIETFVDRSFTTQDTCYSKFGMTFNGITNPGYRYWRSNKLYNRRSFQKHKLSEKLDHFDPDLTESENMFANGYRRLWDSGNLKYGLKI